MCWLLFGHLWNRTKTRQQASREMNSCIICGKVSAGPD